MLKKLILLTFAAFTFAACNDDKDDNGLPAGYHYATQNPYIVNGFMQGQNLHLFGTSTSTAPNGSVFTDDKTYFEFAGGEERVSIYMHATRFVEGMPAQEMRIPRLEYTGNGNAIAFQSASIVPEAIMGATGAYAPMPKYTITALSGSVTGITAQVSFTCMGFKVQFNGKLIDDK